jgi:hypothetical protein
LTLLTLRRSLYSLERIIPEGVKMQNDGRVKSSGVSIEKTVGDEEERRETG